MMCEYAGLYRAETPKFPARYFIVMRSVFDPALLGDDDELYDLKGSLVNRKKQEGQKVGKDEDWVEKGMRLHLSPSLRRELCAAHACDVGFLSRFGVMDYSLLLAVHKRQAAERRGS